MVTNCKRLLKKINNIHFLRLTALDIINFALGLNTLFEHIFVQSYFFGKSCRTRKLLTINTIPITPTMVFNAAIAVFRLKSQPSEIQRNGMFLFCFCCLEVY